MFQIIPLSQTHVDWNNYLRTTTELLGRSPTRKFDEEWRELRRNLSDYLLTLREIDGGSVASLLGHIHIGLIIVASKNATLSIVTKSQLHATVVATKHEDFNLTILSGTLDRWRNALLNCCIEDRTEDVRRFGTELLNVFTQLDLLQYFGISAVAMADGTKRLLEPK